MSGDVAALSGVPVVVAPVEERLSKRQLVDYRDYKSRLLNWLYHVGKHPEQAEGYAKSTVRQVSYKTDSFYRWVWNERDGYTTTIDVTDADGYMKRLIYSDEDYTASHKATTQKCLKRLFKWRCHELGEAHDWDPQYTFSSEQHQPRDYLTVDERKRIREAAIEYGSIPAYTALTPDERDKWKAHLAQRFEKPKSEVSPDDWPRANGWKIPSLVWTSLDTGLRPIEVGRARTSWVDVENHVLRIPESESSKNRDNWIVSVTDRTASALRRWVDEREQYGRYEDSSALWLTRQGNPYNSNSLRYVLHRLCDIADIPVDNRRMSWYAIRHSVGTYMTREEDLAAAKAQLRHKSVQTTVKYDQAPVEDRRDALDRIG
jgi:integrase